LSGGGAGSPGRGSAAGRRRRPSRGSGGGGGPHFRQDAGNGRDDPPALRCQVSPGSGFQLDVVPLLGDRQLVQRALHRDPALHQDGHAVADRLQLAEQVAVDEHRLALLAQPAEHVADVAPADGSTPSVGSSSTTRSGSATSACASPTRCIMPLE
jgi:hypothetical protein